MCACKFHFLSTQTHFFCLLTLTVKWDVNEFQITLYMKKSTIALKKLTMLHLDGPFVQVEKLLDKINENGRRSGWTARKILRTQWRWSRQEDIIHFRNLVRQFRYENENARSTLNYCKYIFFGLMTNKQTNLRLAQIVDFEVRAPLPVPEMCACVRERKMERH